MGGQHSSNKGGAEQPAIFWVDIPMVERPQVNLGDRLLCLGHAQQWREDDGLKKLNGPNS